MNQGMITNIGSLILIIGVFYFMIIRPQKKRQDSQKRMIESLKSGDKVITIGGIHGRVIIIDDDTVIIALDEDNKSTLELSKVAISQIVPDETKTIEEEYEEEEYEDDDEYDDDEYEYEDDDDEDEDDDNSENKKNKSSK